MCVIGLAVITEFVSGRLVYIAVQVGVCTDSYIKSLNISIGVGSKRARGVVVP